MRRAINNPNITNYQNLHQIIHQSMQMVMAFPNKSLALILNERKQVKHQNLSFDFDEKAIMGDIL